MKLATWMAMGAAATVASASCAASAVLYRGDVFTGEGDSGTSRLLRFLFFRKGFKEEPTTTPGVSQSSSSSIQQQHVQGGAATAAKAGKRKGKKGSKTKGARRRRAAAVAAEGPVDPLLRRRALPTAVKALGISTAMAATVGSVAAAMLIYAVEDGTDEGPAEAAEPAAASAAAAAAPPTSMGSGAGAKGGAEEVQGGNQKQSRTLRHFLESSFKNS